ncbi:ATP-binding cassette domain-containing protein, partial [Pseudomonas sp. SIMBA_068]|uniref:ATP-binding cassette domain-containing protein n=1 Tax=Pseudomonas sp. SIMBA_068 TaxID=3085808 RepID=UPI00397B3209
IDAQFDKNNIALTLNNISYKYDEHNALTNVSFVLKSRQKVAIVGRSGSGKTTLVNLLTGLWPLQQGSITLGDHNNAQDL